MADHQYIPIAIICERYEVEPSFFDALAESGLLVIIEENHEPSVEHDFMSKLERLIRLHQHLDINVPGLEAITGLLDRIEQLQRENQQLHNALQRFK